MSESKKITDPKEIMEWAERQGGIPAIIKGTDKKEKGQGLLRIHFPGKSNNDENFEEISWKEFFKEFDDSNLALLHDPKSNFNKIVNRD